MPYFKNEEGITLYYRESGDKNGKTVILLHGWNSDHTMYDGLSFGLQDCNCIIPDFRGVGKSSLPLSGISMGCFARDVDALIAFLGLKDVYMLGYSMGASVVYKYVDLFGTGKLKKIILCDMSPKLLNDDEWKEGLGQGKDDPMTDIIAIEQMLDDYPAYYKSHALQGNPNLANLLPPEVLDKLFIGQRSINTDYVMTCMYASFLLQDYRPMLHKIDIPTGIFFGDPGSVYQPKTAYYIAEHIKGEAKVVIFKGGTHLFGYEQPEKFIKEVRAFFDCDESQ
jgi:pimeloyl-ACP methyl ester carboxylesterase